MAEKKVYVRFNSETGVSSATVGNIWTQLANVPQGVGHGQRVGREIRLHDLSIKGLMHNNATGTHIVRMVVGYFNDNTGVPSTTAELFDSSVNNAGPITGGGITGGDGITALHLPINKAKMTVLVDRLIKIGAGASIDGNNVRIFSVRKALRNAKILFEAGTEGPDNQSKHLYLGFWTAEGGNDTAGGTTVELSWNSQLHFTDM